MSRIQEVVIDCADAGRLSAFWGTLLSCPWGSRPGFGGVVDAGSLFLYFQPVPESKGSPKNRLHLDVEVEDLHRAVAGAEELGATRVGEYHEDADNDGSGFVVMHDPEANEFCFVVQPRGSWGAFLRSVIADGSRSVDPYAACPVLETDSLRLRLVSVNDAEDLLACYADPAAQALFNADNCTSDFRYPTVEQMREAIRFWLDAYRRRHFVRLTILDRASGSAIGTLEAFGAPADADNDRAWGVARIDLAPAREELTTLGELFALISRDFFGIFDVQRLFTRIPPEATARREAAAEHGFEPFAWTRPGSTSVYYAKTLSPH
jgi:RimJ/RimL family protein N-acetyltransferase